MVENFCVLDVDCQDKKQDYCRYNYYSTQNSFKNGAFGHNTSQLIFSITQDFDDNEYISTTEYPDFTDEASEAVSAATGEDL